MHRGAGLVGVLALVAGTLRGAENVPVAENSPAARGYRLLTTKPYLPPDFDQEVFDELWKTWEEPFRSQAEHAGSSARRRLTFARYGLTDAPQSTDGVALQYVAIIDRARGPGATGWAMNCFACHGGQVAGQVIPGLPNTLYALQTLTEECRATKERLAKPLAHMDRGSMVLPLGGSVGTTNAVSFGRLLLWYRETDLVVNKNRPPPILVHHDMDAPAWWHVKRKQRLYIDGFAPKSPRALMQFLLIPSNGPQQFAAWERDYADILAWIESIEPPPWPGTIDRSLAEQGRVAFERVCAECHGSYGPGGKYPERMVPIDVVGTDRLRFDALAGEGRQRYAHSWFVGDARVETVTAPTGYVAPPLDGVWASAPYLHNGSVPTLWHLLRPDDRPTLWRRTEQGYDRQRVGLEIATFDELPPKLTAAERRRYFDTQLPGKSAGGHGFPSELSESEKQAVLEYLKSI